MTTENYTPNLFISCKEAQNILKKNLFSLEPQVISLKNSLGLITAKDILSPTDLPLFNQSSFDGYAINFEYFEKNRKIEIVDAVQAGKNEIKKIDPHQCFKIFTGAPIPEGADTILMVENAVVEKNYIVGSKKILNKGDGFRKQGAEIEKNTVAFPKNIELTPSRIGFLASMGIDEVEVFPKPKVNIIITGNELAHPGDELTYGQIYDANSIALISALKNLDINTIEVHYVKDNLIELVKKISDCLTKCEMLLISGGISMGDYDFSLKALLENNVEVLFHKIKQRPGKPILAGKKNKQWVFALPGNPASVLTCFYIYVHPILLHLMNKSNFECKKVALLGEDYSKNTNLTHYLKGYFDGSYAHILSAQESFRLSSFVKANCLIEIEEDREIVKKNEEIYIYFI